MSTAGSRKLGPSRRVENLALARQAEVIDASGRVVMPGFVDSHTHLVSGPARIPDYQTGVADGDDTIEIARTIQDLSPRTLQTQAQDAVDAAVRHGTTTLEAKSGFGITESNEIKILRVQGALRKQSVPLTSTFFCAQIPPDHRQPQRWIRGVAVFPHAAADPSPQTGGVRGCLLRGGRVCRRPSSALFACRARSSVLDSRWRPVRARRWAPFEWRSNWAPRA